MRFMEWPEDEVIYVLEDDERIAYDLPSTLVRVTGKGIEVLRKGPVSEEEILRAVSQPGNF